MTRRKEEEEKRKRAEGGNIKTKNHVTGPLAVVGKK